MILACLQVLPALMPLCGLSHVCPTAALKATLHSLFVLLPSIFILTNLIFKLHSLMPNNTVYVKWDGVVSSNRVKSNVKFTLFTPQVFS